MFKSVADSHTFQCGVNILPSRSIKTLLNYGLISLLLFGFSGLTTIHAETEDDKITAADENFADQFGISVAVSGSTGVIGADSDDDDGSKSGSAYVFDCSSVPCTQVSKLTANDAAANDLFGYSVAISGTIAVIGAYGDDDAGSSSGSAYVFDCSNLPCTQVSKLTANDAAGADFFGWSVAVSGTTAVVGSLGDDDGGSFSGSAYVFDCSSFPCNQVSKLTANDDAAGDSFGWSVAISGATAVIGSPGDDDAGGNSGSAYIFDCSNFPCTQTSKLIADDDALGDLFGTSVAISGTNALVGAYADDDSGSRSGSAYLFDCSSVPCTEVNKLIASDGTASDFFGYSVAMSGSSAMIGAYGEFGPGFRSGAAYVFSCSSTPCTQVSKLTATDAIAGDFLGWSVAISSSTALAGAYGDDDAGGNSGSAYVFSQAADADGDGILDEDDNCPTSYNPGQEQTGNNVGGQFGDACVSPTADISDDATVAIDVEIGADTIINKDAVIESGVQLGDNVTVNKDTTVGEGSLVGNGTTIEKDVTIGSDALIGDNVTINKDCIIGDMVTIGDNTVLGKDCVLADGVDVGMNVTTNQNVTIQADVPDNTTIPANTVWPSP